MREKDLMCSKKKKKKKKKKNATFLEIKKVKKLKTFIFVSWNL
jgi:hypothetical protein